MRCNIKGLEEGTYKIVGEMIATMVAQNGPIPKLFTAVEVDYLLTGSTTDLNCVNDCSAVQQAAIQQVTFHANGLSMLNTSECE